MHVVAKNLILNVIDYSWRSRACHGVVSHAQRLAAVPRQVANQLLALITQPLLELVAYQSLI